MNTDRLHQILSETTVQLRKGAEIEGTPELVEQIKRRDKEITAGGVAEIYMMPHVSEARGNLEQVDVHFIKIGVDKEAADRHRAELIDILRDWPNPEELAGGPSYISVGGTIGDQGAAFQLFALGKALGLWSIVTPATFGATGDMANQLAGMGYIMMSGFDASRHLEPSS